MEAKCLHEFVPADRPGYEGMCMRLEPDQDNEPCGWPREDHASDGYTSYPTHVRIFREEWNEQESSWAIDGMDDHGDYTEPVWAGYATREEALAEVEEFVKEATQHGVQWRWNAARPRRPVTAGAR